MDLLHSLTIGDILREHARSYPQRLAVIDDERRYTWPAFDARVNQLCHALQAEGFGAGDRILWLGQNSFRILEGLAAAAKLGGIFCPANWRQSAKEFEFVIDDVDPKVIIWQQGEIGDVIREAREAIDASGSDSRSGGSHARWLQHDAADDDADSYEAFIAGHPTDDPANKDSAIDIDPAAPALMLYTAAFTGTPNGALLSHTAILTQDMVMGMMQEITNDYVYLNCGPLFHVATFMTTMATFHFGGTNVFTPRVEADELCRLIDAEQCTGAFIMGPTQKEMSELNADGRYNLKSLRAFAGHPKWNEMITVDTSPWARRPAGFGQTEVMGMLTLNAWGGEAAGNSGRPTPMMQVRIVDPDGVEVPPGETGEITARGPAVMNGYHNRPELNAARLAGGWHHTNDLGRREMDGSISFVGPKTRIIKSAAENIYPAEVEACLQTHPAVQEAAVIGVPDAKWDQSVKAIVVVKEGESVTAHDLIEHCRANIASYKKPRSIEFIDQIPRLGWPIDYDTLDERFGGGGYPGEKR